MNLGGEGFEIHVAEFHDDLELGVVPGAEETSLQLHHILMTFDSVQDLNLAQLGLVIPTFGEDFHGHPLTWNSD